MTRQLLIAAALTLTAPVMAAPDPLAPLDSTASTSTTSTHFRTADLKPSAFGSVALRAGVTMYDARFRRVSSTDASAPEVMAVAREIRGLSPRSQLVRVHQLVGQRVSFMSDAQALKVSDLWLNAGETLRNGHGDDEDIAIAKMQALKAAGFPARDLYLSVGRMQGVGAHVVLLARTDEGYYALDHLRTSPINANVASGEFKPVVSVGTDGSWVHGYRTARR